MRTLLAERHHATIANAIVSVGFKPAGRQLTATSIATTNRPLKFRPALLRRAGRISAGILRMTQCRRKADLVAISEECQNETVFRNPRR